MRALALLMCALLAWVGAKTVDIDLNRHRQNRDGWKDPNDFLGSKRQDTDKDKLAMEGRLRSMDSMTKLMIRKFLENLEIDLKSTRDVHRRAVVTISAENLATIRNYLDSNQSHNQIILRQQVHSILEGFLVVAAIDEDPSLSGYTFGYDVSSMYNHPVAIPIGALVVMGAVIYIQRRLTLRMILFGSFLFCFICSCVLNAIKKHQEIVTEQMVRMHSSSLSEACQPGGFFGDLISVAKGFLLMKTKSECHKFHEDLLINPLAQMNPLEIMSEVLASFVAAPLSVFARHFNKFFNEYYADTPIHVFVIKTVMLVLGTVVAFFAVSGYRLRTIFATLEPGTEPVIQQIANAIAEPVHVQAVATTNTTEALPPPVKPKSLPTLPQLSSVANTDDSSCSSSPEISRLDDSNVSMRRKNRKIH